MAKQDPDDVKREIDEQEDEFSGEETSSGSSTEPGAAADTQKIYEEFVGSDSNEGKDEPVDTSKEVHDDEISRRGGKKV